MLVKAVILGMAGDQNESQQEKDRKRAGQNDPTRRPFFVIISGDENESPEQQDRDGRNIGRGAVHGKTARGQRNGAEKTHCFAPASCGQRRGEIREQQKRRKQQEKAVILGGVEVGIVRAGGMIVQVIRADKAVRRVVKLRQRVGVHHAVGGVQQRGRGRHADQDAAPKAGADPQAERKPSDPQPKTGPYAELQTLGRNRELRQHAQQHQRQNGKAVPRFFHDRNTSPEEMRKIQRAMEASKRLGSPMGEARSAHMASTASLSFATS